MISLIALAVGAAPPAYPRTVREVPAEFRGAWDELISDGCEGREARLQLEARQFFNFEVAYDVSKVTLKSPTLMEVQTNLDPEFGGPEDGTWTFRLVKGGTALSAADGKPPYYRYCRFKLNRQSGSFERNQHR